MYDFPNLIKIQERLVMKDVTSITISFLFLFILTLPVSIALFSAYGFLAAFGFVVAPLAWFILDSEISHYEMDQYL